MTSQDLFRALDGLDPELIVKAAPDAPPKKTATAKPHRALIPWASLAACLVALLAVGTWMWTQPRPAEDDPPAPGGITRDYGTAVIHRETGVILPWDDRMAYEKYTTIEYGGRAYDTRAEAIGETLLGNVLGSCTASGTDVYTEQTHTASFDVRSIRGVSPERLVAVGMEGAYYVYIRQEKRQPATLGELLDVYDLPSTLPLGGFAVNENGREQGYYQMTEDDDALWQMLAECRGAEASDEGGAWSIVGRSHLSFTATSEALGVYKRVFCVTEDGYIYTNMFDVGCAYFIGEAAAGRMIDYARRHAVEAAREPYESMIGGTLTEIGDGYILIDDTALCQDPDDGMVFRIPTDAPRISRYLAGGGVKVGDTVAVMIRGWITVGEDHTVSGAIYMYRGTIGEVENIVIPE